MGPFDTKQRGTGTAQARRALHAESVMRWLATFVLAWCVASALALVAIPFGAYGPGRSVGRSSETFSLGSSLAVNALVYFLGAVMLAVVTAPLVWMSALAFVARRGGANGRRARVLLGLSCAALVFSSFGVWGLLFGSIQADPLSQGLWDGFTIAAHLLVGAALVASALLARPVGAVAYAAPPNQDGIQRAPACPSPRWHTWSAVALALGLALALGVWLRGSTALQRHLESAGPPSP